MDRLISLAAGKALQQEDIGFRAYGCIVENITNQWYYQDSRRRYIPPYQAGVTIPLAGETTASLSPWAPGQIVQATPIPNEYLTVSFTDTPVNAGGGINVSGQSGPTTLPVTNLDLTEGGTPAVPTAGMLRLWADASGLLHGLASTGLDELLGGYRIGLLSGASPSYSFTNIPQVFRNLQLLVYGKSDSIASAVAGLRVQANVDTAAHYYAERLQANAAAPAASEDLADTSARLAQIAGSSGTAVTMGGAIIDLLGYSQANREKVFLGRSFSFGGTGTGSLYTMLDGAFWDNPSAITSLLVFPALGGFTADSYAELLGVP